MQNVDVLEQYLLSLGRQEVALEKALSALLEDCRSSGNSGLTDRADKLWALYDESRIKLALLQNNIRLVESELYRLRRRSRL